MSVKNDGFDAGVAKHDLRKVEQYRIICLEDVAHLQVPVGGAFRPSWSADLLDPARPPFLNAGRAVIQRQDRK
jgi:hypothetical protein